MNRRNIHKATFVEVFGSMKFSGKQPAGAVQPRSATGFAVNKSKYIGQTRADEYEPIRSSN